MNSMNIKEVVARQILDCKGRPAVEVDIVTEGGIMGRASASTGTSVGENEAFVLRDNDPEVFEGLSVYNAIENINKIIAPRIIGLDVSLQSTIDNIMIELDGTENKRKLGGNSIYAISLSCARTAANALGKSLYRYLNPGEVNTIPVPTYNMINGGEYSKFSLAFQEFTLVPYKCTSIKENVEVGTKVFYKLGKIIAEYQKESRPSIGNYFAWAPPSDDPRVNFELLATAVKECGVEDKVGYAIDCASNEMYVSERGTYRYMGREIDRDELIGRIKELSEEYNIIYIEDIVEENDWEGFVKASKEINRSIIIGDDFTVTNVDIIKKATEKKAIEGFVLKPNQVGTVTECMYAYEYANKNGLLIVPSIRAGGVVDDAVMEIAIALGAAACKNGCPRSGERIYALNTLIRAEYENPGAKPFDLYPFVRHHIESNERRGF